MAARGVSQDWVVLQRKIFSRWCKQKLNRRFDVKVTDIVEDCKEGVVLYALIEELSESKYPGAVPKQGSVKGRIKQIECINNALKFVWSKGVELKLKPSAEQIADGDEAAVLALVFAIMMKFMKIGDDEESEKLSAKDALLMWCQNKCQGLGDRVPAIDGFKKTGKAPFHSGVALCAILHKHRPALVPLDKPWTVELAQDAAERYFALEKFVTPAEVAKLDENSMVVYVSEFYYGIMEQRKIDLAARRISKLIKLTIENDRLKAEYNRTAAEYKERLVRVERELEDRTIDDTLAGAQHRLEMFYKYKTDDKNVLLAAQLTLEGLFNNLAMRLAHHKRPEFIPPAGVSLKDVEVALQHLEKVEQERSVALHAELNRQLRLAKLGEQHKSLHEVLHAWCVEKEEYLRKHDPIDTVSAAELQLRLLEAFVSEAAATRESSLRRLREIGAELLKERYEKSADVREREADVNGRFETLDKLAAERQPVLQDDLAREQLREKTRLLADEFDEKYEEISRGWVAPKREYLTHFAEVRSVAEARVQLSLLEAYGAELTVSGEPALAALRDVSARIQAAKHASQFSTWEFEHTITKDPVRDTHVPEDRKRVIDREAELVAAFEELAALTARKLEVLNDHLARELFVEETRLIANTHADKYTALANWLTETEAVLAQRPQINSSNEARAELSLLETLKTELGRMRTVRLAEFAQIGAELLKRKYHTDLSDYEYEHSVVKTPTGDFHNPELRAEVERRLAEVAERFDKCDVAAERKRVIMQDHFDREAYAEATRVMAKTLSDKYTALANWLTETEAVLAQRPQIHESNEARAELSLLEALTTELGRMRTIRLAEFAQLGAELLKRKYHTDLSDYEYEHSVVKTPTGDFHSPELRAEVERRLAEVAERFDKCDVAAERKRVIMQDHFDREAYAEATRVFGKTHADMYQRIATWVASRERYLKAREDVRCVADATTLLAVLAAFEREKSLVTQNDVIALKNVGKELLARKRETELSFYEFEHTRYSEPAFERDEPAERASITEHEQWVDAKLAELGQLAEAKKRILDDHLAREEEAARVRIQGRQHQDMFGKLTLWLDRKEKYLRARIPVTCVADALKQLTFLERYAAERERFEKMTLANFYSLAEEVLAAEYKSEISSFKYDHISYSEPAYDNDQPENRALVEAHVAEGQKRWGELGGLEAALLEELRRAHELEVKKEKLRLEWAHAALQFTKWCKDCSDNLAIESFGFTLEEVQAHKASVDASSAELNSQGASRFAAAKAIADEAAGLGVTSNIYSTLTVADTDAALKALQAAIKARDEAFAKELERQIENDKLCREFASLADPFSKAIIDSKDLISSSKLDLEAQLGHVVKQIAAIAESEKKLEAIRACAAKMEARQITHNRHTTLTLKDVEAQWAQFGKFLAAKKTMLEQEIENAKLRGVTPEQFREIEENFKRFDKDNSGDIDRKELSACLYSLGEERSGTEIKAIMAQYGDAKTGKISYANFREMMLHILGDSDTKEEVINGLILINRGSQSVAIREHMEAVLPVPDIEYIEKTAPKKENGVDFRVWVEEVFSR